MKPDLFPLFSIGRFLRAPAVALLLAVGLQSPLLAEHRLELFQWELNTSDANEFESRLAQGGDGADRIASNFDTTVRGSRTRSIHQLDCNLEIGGSSATGPDAKSLITAPSGDLAARCDWRLDAASSTQIEFSIHLQHLDRDATPPQLRSTTAAIAARPGSLVITDRIDRAETSTLIVMRASSGATEDAGEEQPQRDAFSVSIIEADSSDAAKALAAEFNDRPNPKSMLGQDGGRRIAYSNQLKRRPAMLRLRKPSEAAEPETWIELGSPTTDGFSVRLTSEGEPPADFPIALSDQGAGGMSVGQLAFLVAPTRDSKPRFETVIDVHLLEMPPTLADTFSSELSKGGDSARKAHAAIGSLAEKKKLIIVDHFQDTGLNARRTAREALRDGGPPLASSSQRSGKLGTVFVWQANFETGKAATLVGDYRNIENNSAGDPVNFEATAAVSCAQARPFLMQRADKGARSYLLVLLLDHKQASRGEATPESPKGLRLHLRELSSRREAAQLVEDPSDFGRKRAASGGENRFEIHNTMEGKRCAFTLAIWNKDLEKWEGQRFETDVADRKIRCALSPIPRLADGSPVLLADGTIGDSTWAAAQLGEAGSKKPDSRYLFVVEH